MASRVASLKIGPVTYKAGEYGPFTWPQTLGLEAPRVSVRMAPDDAAALLGGPREIKVVMQDANGVTKTIERVYVVGEEQSPDKLVRTVILTDVLDSDGEQVAAGLDRAAYRNLDVRSEEGWQRVVDEAVAGHGRVDILVNNAAIDLDRRFEATSLEDFERVVAINQTGVFLGMRTVANAMITGGHGGGRRRVADDRRRMCGVRTTAPRAEQTKRERGLACETHAIEAREYTDLRE